MKRIIIPILLLLLVGCQTQVINQDAQMRYKSVNNAVSVNMFSQARVYDTKEDDFSAVSRLSRRGDYTFEFTEYTYSQKKLDEIILKGMEQNLSGYKDRPDYEGKPAVVGNKDGFEVSFTEDTAKVCLRYFIDKNIVYACGYTNKGDKDLALETKFWESIEVTQ